MPTPEEVANLPLPSPHVQFLIEMDRLEQLQRELFAYADRLEEQLQGPWIELRNICGIVGVFRMQDVLDMRQGICKLFGVPYKKEWMAEERRWERASEGEIKQQLELRDAVLVIYHNRIRQRPAKERDNEAREVAGWDSPRSADTTNRGSLDHPGGEHPP